MPLPRIDLPGLDGANLLGYLAALGTLRTLAVIDPLDAVRLSWTDEPGWWMPVVHHPSGSADQLVSILSDALGGDPNPAWSIGEDLTVPRAHFAEQAGAAVVRASNSAASARSECDFLAAFGSDGCAAHAKEDLIADTAFRTMSGAGHQHFLGFMKELHRSSTADHVRSALLDSWEYADGKPSMRWDPNDYRPHALRAVDPSDDPIRTVRGANRLALEALPLFPTMPRLRGLLTTGFDQKGEMLTYPVWTAALDCASASSVIALDFPEDPGAARQVLQARGIGQLFRTGRFTEGKYRNFTPSRALL